MRDRGDIVIGWLTKLAVALAVVAVVLFEAVSLGVSRVSVQEVANDAAREAAHAYRESHNVRNAYAAALRIADDNDATIPADQFTVFKDGTVVLTAHKTARSMILFRFDATKDVLEARAEGRARFGS